MILYPLLAMLSNVIGIVVDKFALSRQKIQLDVFKVTLFLLLCLFTAIFLPFLGSINITKALTPTYLIIFGLMLVTAIVWNIFYYQGIQKEKLYEFQTIITFTPLVTILLASLLFIEERKWQVELAAIIASLALIFAHVRKSHFQISQYSAGLIICVILTSLELILIKVLLNVYSPVSLYFLRTLIIFIFFALWYRPNLNNLPKSGLALIAASAVMGAAQMILKFYGFEFFGVVYTVMVMTLGPILVYLSCFLIFKEELKKRTILAALVILACIVWATFQ
ncbi:MAG TPA: DMT family transporter [Patescibacteria group bacterium]|nr:DMT family transporter [Patescibacteria group bacterium]